MKTLNFKLLVILSFTFLFASCGKDYIKDNELTSSHDFLIEDLMGNPIDHIIYDDGISVTRNGYGTNDMYIAGSYVVNSASGGRGGIYSGLAFTLNYAVEKEASSDKISREMFEKIWEVDKTYEITTDEFQNNHNGLYYGKVEGDKVIQYESNVNSSDGNNYIKILRQEYIGSKEDPLKQVYEIDLEFNGRLTNIEDPSDSIYIKDGEATVRVIYFVPNR